MTGRAVRDWFVADDFRRVLPFFSLAFAVVAVITQPSSAVDLALTMVPVAARSVWAFSRTVPLAAVSVLILVPVVVAQRAGELEPVMFDACLFAFAAARWSRSLAAAASLGLLAAATPVLVAVIQDPMEVATGIWIVAILFTWVLGRAVARQERLVVELEGTRRQLARQALFAERRRIARDVHDLVGHGLAAVMLQVTSARHVLRRDADAAEEALRSAEEVGRRSMQELRRTVTLLRSDEDADGAGAVPTASDIPALIDEARVGGLSVELQTRGDLARIPPSVGVALYRIAQEALANAAATRRARERHSGSSSQMAGSSFSRAPVGPSKPDRLRSGSGPITGCSGCRSARLRSAANLRRDRHRMGWHVRCHRR